MYSILIDFALSGNNILYVGVYGPKAPCEEVYIKHIGHNNYQVNFEEQHLWVLYIMFHCCIDFFSRLCRVKCKSINMETCGMTVF